MPSVNDLMEMTDLLYTKAVAAIEDRCVAVRNRNAKCRKCEQACIGDAITVDKNVLKISAALCVACGACVAVCPTGAIVGIDPTDEELEAATAQATMNAQGVSVVACARIASHRKGDPDKYATVPCLGRIDEVPLVEMAAHGMQDIVLVDGDCSTCKYGAVSSAVDSTVDYAVRLLESVGSPAIITRASEFPPEAIADDERKSDRAARRGFFTSAGSYAKNLAVSAAEKTLRDKLNQVQPQKPHTLKERLAAGQNGKLPAFEPQRNMRVMDSLFEMGEPLQETIDVRMFGSLDINPAMCSGCGMCVMFCPTDALRYSEVEEPDDPKQRYLEFQASDCTQCRLCVDVCLRRCIKFSPETSTAELFDFEPKLIEIPRPPKGARLFERKH